MQVAHSFDLKGASVIAGSSHCGNVYADTTSVLAVKVFPSGEMLMFTFKRDSKNNVAMAMRYSLNPKKHFQDIKSPPVIQLDDKIDLPLGGQENSYKCVSEETVSFFPIYNFQLKMMITKFHVQAYRIHNSNFGPGKDLFI